MDTTTVETLTQRAGAVGARRHKDAVAVHYGCPPGELAVCVQAVGLADRGDLVTLVIAGEPDELQRVALETVGAHLPPNGVVQLDEAWWCAASPRRIVVLAEPTSEARVRQRLEAALGPRVELVDQSSECAAMAIAGKRTLQLLAALGLVINPRLTPPFGPATLAGAHVSLLLQSDRRALILAPTEAAVDVWRAIEQCGRPLGLSYVGVDALGRYALLERMRQRIA